MTAVRKTVGDLDAFIAAVSTKLEKLTGVQLGKKQETMVRSRLLKRALDLGVVSIEGYASYYAENVDSEDRALISILTTHHTFFFREFQHFEYLEATLLPQLLKVLAARPDKTIRIWSAACSRGQEAYSLAMFFDAVLRRMSPQTKFKIFASDIDPESVELARNGVYQKQEINEIPLHFLGQHWARGSGEIQAFVKAKQSLKQYCEFKPVNLFDTKSFFNSEKFDIIFCRNVFIYFTPEQIKEIMTSFQACLQPEGQIFLGVSESISGLGLDFESVGPSIYRKKQTQKNAPVQKSAAVQKTDKQSAPVANAAQARKPIRVVTVDDSATVHTLLKQILGKDSMFEIVGTAINGKDAATKISALKPDVVTLDIHMPEMDGISYLKNFNKAGHPPVVMISSVSREDSDLAFQALELGAADYVEKPALVNLEERGEEIRVKLRAAVEFASSVASGANLGLDKAFAKTQKISKPDSCAVIVIGNISQRKNWEKLCKDWGDKAPPLYFLIEGGDSGLSGMAKKISSFTKVKVWENTSVLKSGEFGIASFKKSFNAICGAAEYKKITIIASSGISKNAVAEILKQTGKPLIVEDNGTGEHPLKEAASFYVPFASFAYHCWQLLAD